MEFNFTQEGRGKKIKIPKISPGLAEDIGIHIGDGSMGHWKSGYGKRKYVVETSGHIIEDVPYITKFVGPLKTKLFNVNTSIIYNKNAGTIVLKVYSKNLVKFYNSLDIPMGPKENIMIPNFILNKTNLYPACLRGLFDTDGSLAFVKGRRKNHSNPVIHFSNKSKALIIQICKLLSNLKIPYSLCSNVKRYDKRTNKTYIGNDIYIQGKKNLEIWMNIVGFNNIAKSSRYLVYKKIGYCPPKTTLKQRLKILNGEMGGI